MATPLVAPSVVRFSVNGRYADRPLVNILDVVISGLRGIGRSEALGYVSELFLNAWTEVILDRLTAAYTAESLTWVDLDSADGEVGSITATDDHTWPKAGGRQGAANAGNVATLVTKVASQNRGTRNGRWFLPPAPEPDTNGNLLAPSYQATLQAGTSVFLERMTETGLLAPVDTFPTVVHTRNTGTAANPNIVYAGNTQITNLRVETLQATQRRRLRP